MAMQPPPPGPPAPAKQGMSTCLIVALAVLGAFLVIGAIVGVIAVAGMRKYLATAKTAEAKNNVSAIARYATAAYERESFTEELLVAGKPPAEAHRLCGSATPVPGSVPAGTKYQPSSASGADFQTGSADAGWPCLKFSVTTPIYYQYSYVKGAGTGKSGATANGFEASARGDLDGNGATSLFARGADVRGRELIVSPQLYIENELE